jgi:hypothetical protein
MYLLFLCTSIWFSSSVLLFPASGCYEIVCRLLYLHRIELEGENNIGWTHHSNDTSTQMWKNINILYI